MKRGDAKSVASDDPLWLRFAPGIFLLLWSGGFAFAKIDPITFLAVRYAMVLVLLAPLWPFVQPSLPVRRIDWLHLAFIGFLIQVFYFGLTYTGFKLGVSAGAMALIVSLQPILVALLAPAMVGETIGLMRWVGLALGLAGAGLVILARSAVEVTSVAGILCAFGALIGMSVATLYEKRFGVRQHPLVSNLVYYAIGLAGTLPIAWATEDMKIDWSVGFVISILYLVIGNSIIAITLLLAMVRRGEASRVSALFFLVPPCAALIAWAILGEHMPPLAWAGLGLAALGVALASRSAKPT
jgi:drug/metabolite transporter (DMT)-like permease